MDKLILENFRTYKNRTEIDFAPITILTGKNNSGKSTIIKAILLLNDFLNSDNQLILEFDGPSAQKHKIDCMSNALTWGSESKTFEITYEKDGYLFTFHFSESTLSGNLHKLEFVHLETKSKLVIECLAKSVLHFKVDDDFLDSFNPLRAEVDDNEIKLLSNSIIAYTLEIEQVGQIIKSTTKGSPESIELISRRNSLLSKTKDIQKRINEINATSKKGTNDTKLVYDNNLRLETINDTSLTITSLLRRFLSSYFNSDEFKKDFGYTDTVKSRNLIFTSPERLNSRLNFNAHHLGPNRTHQARLYLNQDRGTEINEIMAEYAHKEPPKGSVAYLFLIKWMSEFEIGTNVRVIDVKATASYLEIENQGRWQNLTDKGFGAGQVLTILMKICNEVQRQKEKNISYRQYRKGRPIIMIEEPETNLHPYLQSRLAEMFYDAHKQFGIRFLLETHSEYLIRKTQAIINKTNDLDAFKLYYIDNSKGIHEMRYRIDGKFIDEFGPGFFDESSNLAFELF